MDTTASWSDFIEELLTKLNVDQAGLSRLTGISASALVKWRTNPAVAVPPVQIRKLTETKEIADLGVSYLDGLIAAGIITPADLDLKVSPRRTPLSEYSDGEILREVTNRVKRSSEKIG